MDHSGPNWEQHHGDDLFSLANCSDCRPQVVETLRGVMFEVLYGVPAEAYRSGPLSDAPNTSGLSREG